MARKCWIDPDTNEPLIDEYAKQLDSFVRAFQDGVISDKEISDQEARLVEVIKNNKLNFAFFDEINESAIHIPLRP